VTRPLLAVDGDSFAHRAYHALPKTIRRAEGRPAGALVGFANMLLRLWEAEQPRAVLVAWDTIGTPTYRHVAFEGYQSGRHFDAELLEQLDLLPQLVASLGFAYAKGDGYEADDFIAAAVAAEEERGGEVVVLTNDRDLFQLASAKTTILRPRRRFSEIDRVGPAEVKEIYGVEPELVPDFIALRGDSSDRIPGAAGIGPGRAATILKRYGSLDAAIQGGAFPKQADDLREYLRIARLQYEAPVPDIPDAQPQWERASELVGDWGLKALAKRLGERA
jgi:DNA polymerase-1